MSDEIRYPSAVYLRYLENGDRVQIIYCASLTLAEQSEIAELLKTQGFGAEDHLFAAPPTKTKDDLAQEILAVAQHLRQAGLTSF
jgi:hypothetical protein